MWVSKKRWMELEKKITDLEVQVQSQSKEWEDIKQALLLRYKSSTKASPYPRHLRQ